MSKTSRVLIFILAAAVILWIGFLFIASGYENLGLVFIIGAVILTSFVPRTLKKEKFRVIRFRKLVTRGKRLKECPNCGAGEVVPNPETGGYPQCLICETVFVEQRKIIRWLWFRRRVRVFRMMSAEEYEQMMRDKRNQHTTT
jgi:hypothetical protein